MKRESIPVAEVGKRDGEKRKMPVSMAVIIPESETGVVLSSS